MLSNAADECFLQGGTATRVLCPPTRRLNTSHVSAAATCELEVTSSSIGGLADNLVARLNEHWVDFPAIRDIEETVPAFDNLPQRLESCPTAIADDPCQNSSLLVVNGSSISTACCACCKHWFAVHPNQSPLGFPQTLGPERRCSPASRMSAHNCSVVDLGDAFNAT